MSMVEHLTKNAVETTYNEERTRKFECERDAQGNIIKLTLSARNARNGMDAVFELSLTNKPSQNNFTHWLGDTNFIAINAIAFYPLLKDMATCKSHSVYYAEKNGKRKPLLTSSSGGEMFAAEETNRILQRGSHLYVLRHLPKHIDFAATAQAFVAQFENNDFTRPHLISRPRKFSFGRRR